MRFLSNLVLSLAGYNLESDMSNNHEDQRAVANDATPTIPEGLHLPYKLRKGPGGPLHRPKTTWEVQEPEPSEAGNEKKEPADSK